MSQNDPPTTPATEPKALLLDKIKQILFTTSSDISNGVVLAFDLKTKDITITEYQTKDRQTKVLEVQVNDLFDSGSLPVDSLIASNLQFHHGNFKRLFQQILGFMDSANVIADSTQAMEVVVNHYEIASETSVDYRILTRWEFVLLLYNLLNVAQFKLYRESLLIQESRNAPDWDEESGEKQIIHTPSDIFTVIRLNMDEICDVSTFSNRTTALGKIQDHIDEICQGYPKGKFSIRQKTFDEGECLWRTMDGLNQVFLYQTELIDG